MAIPLITGEQTEKESELLDKRYRQVIEALQKSAPEGAIIPEKIQAARESQRELEKSGAVVSPGILDPIELVPDLLGAGAVGAALGGMALKGGAKKLSALAVEKDPQGFYSVLENLFKTKAGKTVTPEEIKGIAKGAKASEVEQSGIESLEYTGPFTEKSPHRRLKISTEEVVQKIQKTKPKLSISEITFPEPDKTSPYYVPQIHKIFKEYQGSGMLLDDYIANESSIYYALQKKNPKLIEDPNWAEKLVKSVFNIDEFTKLPLWSPYKIPGGSKYKETLIQLEMPIKSIPVSSHKHFLEPNIVAWSRTDVRPDVDGKSVLFAQEIQSDWAKQARQKGTYNKDIHENIQYLNDTLDTGYKKFIEKLNQEKDPIKQRQIRNDWEKLSETYQAIIRERQDELWNKVPATPYVETEAYVDLVIKKLIQQAVENKNDRIGIIPGQLVTELYPGIGEKEKKSLIDFYNSKIPSRLKKAANAYGGKIGETVISIDDAIPSLEGLGKPIIDAAIRKNMAAKIPYLEITDEVKENVKRGLPIISAAGAALPSLVEEYRKQKESKK
jgi:hypothetical protein